MSGIGTGCANTYHDMMSQLFEVDGTTQNIKSWISKVENKNFPWNKNNNLCLQDFIFKSFHFLAEVIFNYRTVAFKHKLSFILLWKYHKTDFLCNLLGYYKILKSTFVNLVSAIFYQMIVLWKIKKNAFLFHLKNIFRS